MSREGLIKPWWWAESGRWRMWLDEQRIGVLSSGGRPRNWRKEAMKQLYNHVVRRRGDGKETEEWIQDTARRIDSGRRLRTLHVHVVTFVSPQQSGDRGRRSSGSLWDTVLDRGYSKSLLWLRVVESLVYFRANTGGSGSRSWGGGVV
jgi:hypothetical protein